MRLHRDDLPRLSSSRWEQLTARLPESLEDRAKLALVVLVAVETARFAMEVARELVGFVLWPLHAVFGLWSTMTAWLS